ncbi:MAG: glycosyltransferase family 2 protein [Terrimicrobiaceae bacterium]
MEPPELSIIVPARDEEDNIAPLLAELRELAWPADFAWEVIVIDDASRDRTLDRLREAGKDYPALRVLSFPSHRGKSAALAAGIAASQGTLIGMMDADLQNCPADFLPMREILRREPAVTFIQGHRTDRRDSWAKRQASGLGFLTRRIFLSDRVRDSGCALRLMRRSQAVVLPLHFEGLHRFLPLLAELHGGCVREVPVRHRPRHSGQSKYRIGPVSRGVCGFLDLLAVRWMMWRKRPIAANTIARS